MSIFDMSLFEMIVYLVSFSFVGANFMAYMNTHKKISAIREEMQQNIKRIIRDRQEQSLYIEEQNKKYEELNERMERLEKTVYGHDN